MKISIIVLCYNGIQMTLDCLESVSNLDNPGNEIIVVDNASRDQTPRIVRERFPGVIVLENRSNLGYAAGNNMGLDLALKRDADFIFLVNNDTWLYPSCISYLLESFQLQPNVGVVGPMVYVDPETRVISSAGGSIDWFKANSVNLGLGEIDLGIHARRSVDFINGCGIFVSRKAVEIAGSLDPNYFMYWEETDWCQRIRKKGLDVVFEPASKMIHKAPIKSSELSANTLYYMTRNRFLFFKKYTPRWIRPLTLLRAMHGSLRGIRDNKALGRESHSKAMKYAVLHALKGQWGYTDPTTWSIS